jgi:hypothetical protein
MERRAATNQRILPELPRIPCEACAQASKERSTMITPDTKHVLNRYPTIHEDITLIIRSTVDITHKRHMRAVFLADLTRWHCDMPCDDIADLLDMAIAWEEK